MTFPNDIQTTTPAKYLFKLITATETVICNPEPLEWKSGSLEIKRDLESGGVFSTFHADSLTFVGNGAEFLKKLFEAYELNAKCTLIIYWWKSSTRSYVEFPSRFDINFSFYEVVKIGKFHFGIRVKAINNSTQTKLDNRQDVDVDITKLVSIGGFQISDYPNLKKGLYYDGSNVNFLAHLQDAYGSYGLPHTAHKITFTSIPLTKYKADDFSEVQSVGYFSNISNLSLIPAFFKAAKSDHTFEIQYVFSMRVTNPYNPLFGGSYPWNIQILETKPDGSVTDTGTYELNGFGGMKKTYSLTGSVTVSVSMGNDLKLVVQSPGIDSSYMGYIDFSNISMIETAINSPAALTEGFPLYEAIERTCQHVLDTQFPMYSEFFGRTDVPKNEYNEKYTSESHERFAHIQSGMNQRGLKLNEPLALNFKDLFKTLKAIYNIGYSLEKFNDMLRIRIEEYSYFFQDVEILDLSARLGRYDIQSLVMPELVPIELKSGFESYEYLSVNGLAEPNTTNQRTTQIATASKFENISPYRADTMGIYQNLSNPMDITGTTDTKGDSSIFIIKTLRDETDPDRWKPEKGEYITIDDSTSVFKEELLNRLFTPSRMLKRHGNRIKSGFTLVPDKYLTFQKSDKASNLKTTGEGYTITESENIQISALENPIYKPMKHMVTVLFTVADMEAIQANPLGYIRFSDTLTGYLLSLKKKNGVDKAEVTIIERYT